MQKCWEFMKCPPKVSETCPAVSTHHETSCWRVRGTLCRGERQGSFADKLDECKKCGYYAYATHKR